MMNTLDLYRKMLTVRLVETELQRLCLEGLAGDLHFNKGQEAVAVGGITALLPKDYIVTHHRTIAHTLTKGTPLKALLAELLGRIGGTNRGIAGEMHIRNPSVGHLFTFQLVGTCAPVAAGAAWAAKQFLKQDAIVACFLGDAATSNAQFHEGINIAAVNRLPLLVICENNGLAGNIRSSHYMPTKTAAERMAAYGIDSRVIDGNDVVTVHDTVSQASKIVREQQYPYFIECATTRLCWHKQGQPDARSKEELAELTKLDPIVRLERMIDEGDKKRISGEVAAEVKDAFEFALASPWPRWDEIWGIAPVGR